MKLEIKVPQAGESVTEGDITKWLKKSGEFVEMDEPLLELETDKATLEITAEADGRLEILDEEGKTVKVGAVVGYIEPTERKETNDIIQIEQSEVDDRLTYEKLKKNQSKDQETSQKVSPTAKGTNSSSPASRKLMLEHNISPNDLTERTGKDGRITKQDVLKFIEARKDQEVINSSKHKYEFYNSDAPVISPDETVTLFRHPLQLDLANGTSNASKISTINDDDQSAQQHDSEQTDSALSTTKSHFEHPEDPKRSVHRQKLTRLRKTISRRLVEGQQTSALLTTFNEVDMSAIQSTRRQYKEIFKEKHGVGLGFMSFFTKAVCQALLQYPIMNAQMDKDSILFYDYCDIGIAVATQKGLVVPILRNAESMAFHEIERGILELATKAKNSELSLDDLTAGTFTITNGGVYGSMLSTPIVNSPQSAILGMHNIIDRPVAEDGKVVIKPMMYLALTYDHRLIDGADAVQFLREIKGLCEDPIKLILNL